MSGDQALLLDLPDILEPDHTAVMVIDMQNDFCAPGGWTDRIVKRDISSLGPVARPIQTLIDAARVAHIPVLWVRADYASDRISAPMRARSTRMELTEDCCVPGSWGADWFEVSPLDGEPIFTKHCYSGFSNPGLYEALAERNVRTIVFAGVQSHVCVETTLRDAHSRGFYCVVPEECVASPNVAAHDVMLSNVRMIFGTVVSLPDLMRQWEAGGDANN
jgi:nicotinamidase-related amidase